ncbi:MAG: M36 family metallopeptidase [Thermoanaerobaculia bacterium]
MNKNLRNQNPWRTGQIVALGLAASLCFSLVGFAVETPEELRKNPRDFDRRIQETHKLGGGPTALQREAEAQLRKSVPELMVRYDAELGVARTISSSTGYLTDSGRAGESAEDVGMSFAQEHLDLLGLTPADLGSYEVTDSVFTQVTGATHHYLRQTHRDLPVFNAQLHFNVNRDGRLISVNNAFVPRLADVVNVTEPAIDAATAVAHAAESIGIDGVNPAATSSPIGATAQTTVAHEGISRGEIVASLVWVPIHAGSVRLAWNLKIETLDGMHYFNFNVDAVNGRVWTRFDWIDDAQYKVYPIPIQDPDNTTPLPPADARTTEIDPHDLTYSPFGWHDTDGVAGAEFTIHRGNNVWTWEDSDGNDTPPPAAAEPDCGAALDCTWPMDLSMAPSTYRPASVASTFYWSNIIHDIQAHYGFDEAAGNFQAFNYTPDGLGGDYLRALAQAQGNCNANFFTPADGSLPRMRMFICNNASPAQDGDFDHLVIAHEYGHGISNRLVGGPSNVDCLDNVQQPGEGWSDWFGLVYTAEVGDVGTEARGVGNYLFGNPPDGPGIRDLPYSTDEAVNNWTYESITGAAIPHGVGSRWAQAIWEVYWALVDEHGFDANLYDAMGGAGNQRAMLYVTEGLKDTACSPSFLDTRDGVIQAAIDNYGGEDVCLIWEAFAAWGLGDDAATPGGNSTGATNGFELPTSCSFLGAAPETYDLCRGPDLEVDLTVGAAFVPDVSLSAAASPAMTGATFAFDPEPVTMVPSMSTLTLGNTGGVAGGQYTVTVTATDSTPVSDPVQGNAQTFDLDLTVNVFEAAPASGPTLSTPPNGAGSQSARPTLTWMAEADASTYDVDVATDAGFTNIVDSASGLTDTTYTVDVDLAGDTVHYWRVRGSNACGDGGYSSTFSFQTSPAPGQCSSGATAMALFTDDMESGAVGWTHSGIQDTWALQSTQVNSGSFAWHADDVSSVSDQYLVSPAIALPAASDGLTLQFWNRQELEDGGAGCYDAAVLEISINGGTDWIRIENELLTDPYDGLVDGGFSNPIAGSNAWCGDPQEWLNSVVDISAWAGETANFRFRLATDSSVSHPGWEIDDVLIQSCSGAEIFADGFESGDTSAWP